MKKSSFIALVILNSSLAMAESNSLGGCLDKVSDAAIKQIYSESKGDSTYAMTTASVTNHLESVTKIEDFRQEIVISFDTSDDTGRAIKTFKAQANSRCEFSLVQMK